MKEQIVLSRVLRLNCIIPEFGIMKLVKIFKNVVFPEPLSPVRRTRPLSGSVKDKFLNICLFYHRKNLDF